MTRRGALVAASCGALAAVLALACNEAERREPPSTVTSTSSSATAATAPSEARARFSPQKVELVEPAMGTEVHFVAYTTPERDAAAVKRALEGALAVMRELAVTLTDWTQDSDVGRINAGAGNPVAVSATTFEVVEKGLWAGRESKGAFDLTFQSMSRVWRFGDAQGDAPKPPGDREIEAARRHVDYRRVVVDRVKRSVMVPRGSAIGLGGIAKGYIVDKAAEKLRASGLDAFLVQAGGDLYGAGRKPDGARWVSGIRDPRGEKSDFFATIELEDRAFSTAGDYARSYVYGGKRYHHIIDPKTGRPATASRSVTVWAETAFLADALDDAVFVLGPTEGLALVERTPGAGAVIVDGANRVHVSERLRDRVRLTRPPTDGI